MYIVEMAFLLFVKMHGTEWRLVLAMKCLKNEIVISHMVFLCAEVDNLA
jgi:hypothetical protein